MNAVLYIVGFAIAWTLAIRYDDHTEEVRRAELAAQQPAVAQQQCAARPLVASRDEP